VEIRIFKSEVEASRFVCKRLIETLDESRSVNLGLATGGTYVSTYERLVDAYQRGEVTFNHVRTFNLDEYLDLSPDHPQTYRNFMQRHLFAHVDIPAQNIHFPPTDEHADYSAYDSLIEAKGGIDLQLLGIGANGHIAFNEPGTPFDSRTHRIKLDETTRRANQRFFKRFEDVPHYAVTMGVATILDARSILLSAFGEEKAEAVRAMIKDTPDPQTPATALQKHPDVTIVLDEAAAQKVRA